MYDQNHLANRLRQASLSDGSKTFLDIPAEGRDLSFDDFFAHAEQIAAALVAAGLKPGDRVAVQAEKTPAMLELYVATVLAGGVFLPLNAAYMGEEVRYFLGDATPRIFVCDPTRLDELTPIATEAGTAQIFTLGAGDTGTLIAARDAEKPGFKAVPRAEDDLAAILYTSGTTGRSKGAMLTHRALASNSETLRDYWGFTADDVLIHALPIFHTHGLFVATNITLMAGARALFHAGFKAADQFLRTRFSGEMKGAGGVCFAVLERGNRAFQLRGVSIVAGQHFGKDRRAVLCRQGLVSIQHFDGCDQAFGFAVFMQQPVGKGDDVTFGRFSIGASPLPGLRHAGK